MLCGWALDNPALRSLHSSLFAMKANTAIGLLFGGAALFFTVTAEHRAGAQQRIAQGCAVLVALIGLLTLTEYVVGWNIGIDELLFRDSDRVIGSSNPGRMAPNTAAAFCLVGAGILGLGGKRRPVQQFSEGCLIAVWLIALIAILGYAYRVAALYGVSPQNEMSPHTAVSFFVLSMGAFCAAGPDRGVLGLLLGEGSGSYLGRRLLPAAILIPIALGWLRLQGERAGLYSGEVGVSLFVVATIVLLSTATLWNLGSINEADHGHRKAVAKYRGLLEASLDAIVIIDRAGQIELINSQTQKLFGYSSQDLLGRAVEVLVPDKHRGKHPAHRSGFIAAPHQRPMGRDLELSGVRKDGSEFPVEISLSPLETDEGLLVTATIRDITDRRKTEAALKIYVDLAKHAPVGLTVWHLAKLDDARTLTLTACNPAAARFVGLPLLATRIGQTLPEIFPGAAETPLPEQYAEVVRLGQERGFGEVRGADATTADRVYWVNAFPLPNQSVGLSFEDVTLRKQGEDDLRRAKDVAEAANKELEAFSFSVSHDLRAPLRAIDGFSQVLLEDHADKLDDEGKQHLGRVRAGAQRMGQLIDDLINLARVGRGELKKTTVDLSSIAREVTAELGRTEPDRRVEVVVEEKIIAEGDAQLLRVALENLLGNAWKFTSRQPQARIEFGTSTGTDGHRVYLVRDNGAGFDMTYANKLFGAFQRLHDMQEFSGTGIGLATVQRVIHRHGGKVWAEGTVGRGASFFFTLS